MKVTKNLLIILFIILLVYLNKVFPFDKISGIDIGLINYKELNYKFFANINSLNISILRVSVFWEGIERKKGKYTWERLDYIINQAYLHNKEILLLIGYTPTWMNNGKYEKVFPSDIKAYKKFISLLVNRYKNKVKYYEVWNEPNLRQFWKSKKSKYLELLKVTYTIIKRIDPDAKILNGGIGINHNSIEYSKWLLKNASNYIDIFSIHFYYYWNKPNYKKIHLLEAILELALKYNKKVWITETGIPTCGWDNSLNIKGGLFPYDQAKEFIKMLIILKSLQKRNLIKKIFFYTYKDFKPISLKASNCFGLLDAYNDKKAVFYSFAFINSLLPKIRKCRISKLDFIYFKAFCLDNIGEKVYIIEKKGYLYFIYKNKKLNIYGDLNK